MSSFAIVPKIGGYGNRTTILRYNPEQGCSFIMEEQNDVSRPMEEEAVKLLCAMGAVSLRGHDGEHLFDRLGFTLSADTGDVLPLIHWLMIDDLTDEDITNMVNKNNEVVGKYGKLVQESIHGVDTELRISSNERVGAALRQIFNHNNDHIVQKGDSRSLIAHLS